ncbi:MAG: hypothetical protein ABUL67_03200, partial [Haliangium ochraceum]
MPPQAGPGASPTASPTNRPVVRPRHRSLAILGGLTLFAVALFATFWLADYFLIDAGAAHRKEGPVGQLFDYDAQTMQNALGSLS